MSYVADESASPELRRSVDHRLDPAWQARLATIVSMMKEISRLTDPQAVVRTYTERMQQLMPVTRRISLSRRGLNYPEFRVTRFSGWEKDVNPWKDEVSTPIHSGGLLAELLYGDEPQVLSDFVLETDDPAAEYLDGQRSLMALPLYDQGVALNMVVATLDVSQGFPEEMLPERVWMSNLFGRATQNLVLAEKLEAAYDEVDRELKAVGDMQLSMLPEELPRIPGWKLAVHYQTSKRAGGDYYDFFPLPDGRWGLIVADVSGHGTPAAVMMALTQCITHMRPEGIMHPSALLEFLNYHLSSRYTNKSGHFVTAFCAMYAPDTRRMTYASAGHNPPRLRRGSGRNVIPLDKANYLPLGITADLEYRNSDIQLEAGDRLTLYTDGIVESTNPLAELFGTQRLDTALARCTGEPACGVSQILEALNDFTENAPLPDDQTLIVIDVI